MKDDRRGTKDQESGVAPAVGLSMWQANFLLIAAVVGLGIMALPHSIAKIGWFPGIVILGSVFYLNLYTGMLLWRLRMVYPSALTYTHIGWHAMGQTGKRLAQVVTLIQLFMLEATYLLVNAQSLAAVFYEVDLCKPTWGIFMSLLLLPFVQIRTLQNVSALSILSGVMVCLVLILCLVEMALHGRAPGVQTVWVEEDKPFVWFTAISSMVFACGSQFVYLEVMSEMQHVREFPSSMKRAGSFILFAYMSISAAGYWTYGRSISSYIVDVIPNGPLRRVANVFMLIHTMVSYILMSQVLCSTLIKLFNPIKRSLSDGGPMATAADGEDEEGEETPMVDKASNVPPSREDWLIASMVVMLAAYLVANLIPFFEDLTILIGALIGGPISLGLPALFALHSNSQGGLESSPRERRVLYCILGFTLVVMVLGFASGMDSLFHKWDTLGYPFECHCVECTTL
mmetsp:Transcript_19489/g.32765  ORF Transcript_19489/g.32765 Transcript_19489/m.32765 type:complete len:457 (-) Transcript_19489:546-1916(-)|eukprot:CAMPEP_0198204936 /NCGR_PEP_ID=MMETSP1445-20131203/8423_1 /TAXON_ID=36898 /ORGANISM="Pyramimonas sp., Strain CCMP2087" /LENGTH=456 /DNA_ID=CAMNT_0043877035 /DNA_START=338 /DNA_END=1708 /DNA_ORIENTATION=-